VNESDEKKHRCIFGFFGVAPISKVMRIPEQIPYDYMHLVLQGHTKFILNLNNLFFNKNIFEDQKSVGEKLLYVNKILESIKMPHYINRKATNIEICSKWKSSEVKNFFQSLPIFIKIFPSWFFYRFASYVIALRIMYEPIKSNNDLNTAEVMMYKYVKSLEDTYDEYAYSFTVHAHLHLASQVRSHGPLQCHSQFCFEGALFNLKNLLHGTKGFIIQISSQIFLYKQLPSLINNNNSKNSSLNEFVCKDLNNFHSIEVNFKGTVKRKKFSTEIKKFLQENFCIKSDEANFCDRIFIKNKTFHSKSYSRRGKYNSYSISYEENSMIKYADIEYYLEINNKYFAFINLHSKKLLF
jgi:hypothetical protein